MTIARVRTVTEGLAGGPYLSTHYFFVNGQTAASDFITLVEDFWQLAASAINTAARMNVEPDVDLLDEATGDLVDILSDVGVQVPGTNANIVEWSAKQGLLALNTGTISDGRRVQGRLYIPGVTAASGEQSPTPAYRTDVEGAAAGLVADSATNNSPWVVWRRPRAARLEPTPLPARPGLRAIVDSGSVRTYWGILRSRRD